MTITWTKQKPSWEPEPWRPMSSDVELAMFLERASKSPRRIASRDLAPRTEIEQAMLRFARRTHREKTDEEMRARRIRAAERLLGLTERDAA